MTKYYFVSYISFDKRGHGLITVTDQSLSDITKILATEANTENIVITCLKDLSKEEFNMLKGE